ncbi:MULTISPECIES: hypothetical protein [Paraburkholderia]|uniref:hypothetical protein n=1 Tax=Paraburkholderia TaxID=1822464 RepID=UPI002251CB94|nr:MULTISPECIES: hypothetical protein [Paraburkholderia]MCX4170810.1 hypothetical protein [Paraburkholderia madseniana]MDQ6458822.1 hypothetical protein [Paraburkholderia madseniana]
MSKPSPKHNHEESCSPPTNATLGTCIAPVNPRHGASKCETPATPQSGSPIATKLVNNLGIDELRIRLAALGPPENHIVYAYVVRTVRLRNGLLEQTGSGGNFDGDVVTLCTCKHGMRATLSSGEWRRKWIAGFTSYTAEFGHQQYLKYLMRVGEAYDSQFDLVQALRDSERDAVVDSKDSRKNPVGDVFLPKSLLSDGDENWHPASYQAPMVKHAHRHERDDTQWHNDIEYRDRYGRHPSLLVGDTAWTFVWNERLVRRAHPALVRGHRKWTLADLLLELDPECP